MASLGLGKKFNVVANAGGVDIKMAVGQTVEFVSFVDTGDQVITVQESIGGAGAQNLAVVDEVFKAPGVGGTWVKETQTASHTYTNADATNDCVVVSVRSRELSEGFDTVNVSVSAGTLTAIVHDLVTMGDPSIVDSPV